jgi:hypothetical protein
MDITRYSKIFVLFLFFTSVSAGCNLSYKLSKTAWTVDEVKSWAQKVQVYPTWHGWLLYQGSDSLNHHFISRVMDEWVWFNIKRTDLDLADERIFLSTSAGPLGYYYVNPLEDFKKVKEF